MNRQIYGSSSPEVSKREIDNCNLARIAAREGFVLLKNEGALPLKNKTIALYGMGARRTIKGGTGSGSVNERHSVSIEEGLEKAGYTVSTKKYLVDYDQECDKAYAIWHDEVEEMIAPLPPMQGLMKALEVSFHMPEGRRITKDDIAASNTDTAIYVIARQAGEGNDRKITPGDYQLTDIELENLTVVSKNYAHTIMIINVGGMIDLSFLDNIRQIDGVVYYVQGGMEGGNALADVLSGAYSFSGKLTDTWAKQYADYPGSAEFSYLNGNLEEEYYKEGIYVGYRYFDSFGVKPLYPFGYGLSYTEFRMEVKNVVQREHRICAEVEVQNTGNTYTGKETVQAYLSCPNGKLKKEYQSLVSFEKTKDLAPGESQIVQLSFDFTQAASYDETTSQWILEEGDYVLRVGNSSLSNTAAAVLSLSETIVVERSRSCNAPHVKLTELQAPARAGLEVPTTAVRLEIDYSCFTTKVNTYDEPVVLESEEEKSLLDTLSTVEMAELLRGSHPSENGGHMTLGAAGKTTIALLEKNIPNVVVADGPAGLNVVNHIRISEDGTQKFVKIPERFSFGEYAKIMLKKMGKPDGPQYYRYATAWPVNLLLAQTWNTDLIEQIGVAVGEEMLEFGITLWLAPGLNIHRNPLCGRTFEYYSEDPFISGVMAAAITKGVQRHPGIGTTIKHFCCNNQEDNRMGVSSNVNERALREIYLKGFGIAVKQSQPLALMTSYNRLNGVYTANSHDLLTDILRCEWGYEGMVMTDWSSCAPNQADAGLCAPAGNDLVMPGVQEDKQAIAAALADGRSTKSAIRRCACRILRIILNSDTRRDK